MTTYSGTAVQSTTAARPGMASIIEELRGLTEAGASDYTVGNSSYWDDGQMQDILDLHRINLIHAPLSPYPVVVQGGTLQWFEYRSPYQFFEATSGGTDVFYIQDSAGATPGTALWASVDYRRGVLNFSADKRGTAFFVTGRSYDLNAAAADIWQMKAAHYAPGSFNFSTDNHSIQREQVYTHCKEMAAFFMGMSGSGVQTTERFRSDVY